LNEPKLSVVVSSPKDCLRFGSGSSFEAEAVQLVLALTDEDVARMASAPLTFARHDVEVSELVRARLEDVGRAINLVACVFDGDVERTVAWFKTRNPMLGDVTPRDMIRLGRFERLSKYIAAAMLGAADCASGRHEIQPPR
jgi:hypothetical protein